jgi:putative copper export protein
MVPFEPSILLAWAGNWAGHWAGHSAGHPAGLGGGILLDAASRGGTLLPPGTLVRWIQHLGTALLLGTVVFRFGVIRPLARDAKGEALATEAAAALRLLAWVGAGLLVVAAPLRVLEPMGILLGGGTGSGGGGGGVPGEAGSLLFQTAWGAGWWLHLAVAALALVGVILFRGEEDRPRGWEILLGAAVLLPLAPALSGSSALVEPTVVSVPALYLHVAAMGAWLGGLIALVVAGLPAVRRVGARPSGVPEGAGEGAGEGGAMEGGLPALALLVNRFSRVALPAAGVLVLSGLASAAVRLGGVGALFGSEYGRVLLLKLAFVGAALLLGFYNWKRVRPGLAERPDPGSLRIPASLEAALGVVVLLVAAVLVAMPLP